jgi:hypothetical protein
MATLQKVQIFPAIGIARIGNSPEWYLGPELPFPAPPSPPPGDTYKDEACRIKRQAQRFRLWGFFSDGSDREMTLADGDITWTVHLVNAKPSLNGEGSIDGGLQTLDGVGASASFVGTFGPASVPLGDAETDGDGRLIVRGGFGKSENPTDPSSMPNFPTTPGWYDDVSDGPITAQIIVSGTTIIAENGAWVICPPPRFAPTTYSITTLFDTLRQLALTNGQLSPLGPPSFATDVYPILKRALDMRFVTAFAFGSGDHDTLSAFAPPGGAGDTLANRQVVYAKLRPPPGDMPLLNDGGGTTSQIRDFQNSFIQQWSLGQGTSDWPPVAPVAITPAGLTMAALENCVGAAFFPGIEAGGIPNAISITTLHFAEAFRLDPAQVQPGDVTKGMARPWQGDFYLCGGPESAGQVDQASWWPAARPIGVYPADDMANKRPWALGVAASMSDMVNNWHELGFIVDKGLGKPVETEKTNVCKGCFFTTNRPEISKDEAKALIDSGQHIEDAFYVVVEGLAPADLMINTPNPSQMQLDAWAPKISTNPNPSGMGIAAFDMKLEDSGNLNQVQRITFGYNIMFSSTAAFTAEDRPIALGASVLGLSSASAIDLTTRQHPYMVDGAASWLSADTRVFKLQPQGTFAQKTLQNNPNAFIKDVIESLRSSQQANAWFDALPQDEAGAGLEWSQTLNGQPVFNFAICRVRYRAELNTAPDVRVFFRLFPAMTTSTDFQPGTTYLTGGQPGTKIPLLGIVGGEVVTMPFFAEPRRPVTDSLKLQQDPKNIDTLKIDVGGHETYSYYGCWLDINQPDDKRFPIQTTSPTGPFTGPSPRQSIADLIRGTHQCLVAEINFDLDPISPGATTASSDKLAQRNLAIDHSDNPGAPDTHRVQHTFTIRPTTARPLSKQGPDELMIDWGTTPSGTVGTLYLPGASAEQVMQLADRLYTRNRLKAIDGHSVQMEVTGRVSYVPIPSGGIGDLAGLLTLDLPSHVLKGQTFRVVLHQVIDAPAARPLPGVALPPTNIAARQRRLAARPVSDQAGFMVAAVTERNNSRHIVGAFQFSVLVQTSKEILPIIERTLVNLRRVVGTIPHENRWYPVMQRYLSQVAKRIKALGGGDGHIREDGHDLDLREEQPRDVDHDRREERAQDEGKIAGLCYDGFGDFEGFWLRTKDGSRKFSSKERELESIVTKAWRQRIALIVLTEKSEPDKPVSIVFLRGPSED